MKFAQRLALVTLFATFVLVGVGVLVRATNSGLGCPDWPTCYGGAVPPGDKYAIIEYSHRLVASVVGLLVIGVAFLAWKHYREVKGVFWVALLTVPLVAIQGLLGAVAVVRELPPEVVATHLVTAMLILGCQAFVAIGMVRADPRHATDRSTDALVLRRRMGRAALFGLAWLIVLF
jgi:heme A synthase